MSGHRIGAHVPPKNAVARAGRLDADLIQIFLSNPRSWSGPDSKIDVEDLRKFPVYVHAPYMVNVVSTHWEIFRKSVEMMQRQSQIASEFGSLGVVFHGGNWRDSPGGFNDALAAWQSLSYAHLPVKMLLENQASDNHSSTFSLAQIELVWHEIMHTNNQLGLRTNIGFCLDTCHAWAAGWESADVEELLQIVGEINLLHVNGSLGKFGAQLDRHSPLLSEDNKVDLTWLFEVISASGCEDIIMETKDPWADIAFLKGELNES